MKINRLILPFFLLLAVSGCATHRPAIAAARDSHFAPVRTDKIAVSLRSWPEADVELGRVLTTELEQAGFNLVPSAEADYLLKYMVENIQEVTYRPTESPFLELPPQSDRERMLNLNTYQTLSPVNRGISGPYRAFPQSLPPTKVVFVKKKIRLELYTNPKTPAGNPQLAWSGWIDAGENISAKRGPLLIRALLDYFGKEYSGRAVLTQ